MYHYQLMDNHIYDQMILFSPNVLLCIKDPLFEDSKMHLMLSAISILQQSHLRLRKHYQFIDNYHVKDMRPKERLKLD